MSPNIRWLANYLAQAAWETGRKMVPLEEVGKGRNRAYGALDPETHQAYYGRGLIQITWKYNYQKFDDLLQAGLVACPAKALQWDFALPIMFDGMARGMFTGRRLGQYFSADPKKDDPLHARAIINSSDHAADVASLHQTMLGALT